MAHRLVRAVAPGAHPAIAVHAGITDAHYSRFIVGVQWHPERRTDTYIHDISGPLFEAFVTACTGGRTE